MIDVRKIVAENLFNPPAVKRLLWLIAKILILIILNFVLKGTSELNDKPIIQSLFEALSFYLTVDIIASTIQKFILSIYKTKKGVRRSAQNNFLLGIERIVSIVRLFAFVLSVMVFFNINIVHFITSISIVAAAIALLTKDYITNLINGLIIMFSDRLSLGDYIEYNNVVGKIMDITFINVVMENEEGDVILIPNTTILNNTVLNQSKQAIKRTILELEVPNSLQLSPYQLESLIINKLAYYKDEIIENGVQLKVESMTKDYTKYRLIVRLYNYKKVNEQQIKKEVVTEILSLQQTSTKNNMAK